MGKPEQDAELEAVERLRAWLLAHQECWEFTSGHPCDVAVFLLEEFMEERRLKGCQDG